jgi:hypothetical protein
MVELDDRLLRDLARLQQRSGPPPGAEQRVRAALGAALGPDLGGGDDGGSALGDGGSTFGELGKLGSAGLGGGSSKLALVVKVMAATAAVTGVGVLIVNLGLMPTQQAGQAAKAPVDVAAPKPSSDAPHSTEHPPLTSEAPILVTPLVEPPIRVQRPTAHDEDPLEAEVALLEQARDTDDPTARLQLLEQHHQRFHAGLFAAERESLRIATLCELDRLDAARQAAEEFLLAHPRSPLRLRMRAACPDLDVLAD